MKSAVLLVGAIALAVASSVYQGAEQNLFDFQLVDIQGKPVNMSKYRGNVSLVINVASF